MLQLCLRRCESAHCLVRFGPRFVQQAEQIHNVGFQGLDTLAHRLLLRLFPLVLCLQLGHALPLLAVALTQRLELKLLLHELSLQRSLFRCVLTGKLTQSLLMLPRHLSLHRRHLLPVLTATVTYRPLVLRKYGLALLESEAHVAEHVPGCAQLADGRFQLADVLSLTPFPC